MIRLLLVGCGNMGHAMLAGWMRLPEAPEVVVVEPADALRARAAAAGAIAVASATEIPAPFSPDAVILAVKPQLMAQVLPDYRRFEAACFVSIAAGTTMAALGEGLGGAAIVRCMPNTPAAIGRGVFGFTANPRTTAAQRALVRRLLEPSGTVFELADETMIDRITAVSGSGPAYLFHFIEALTAAARAVGLPDDVASEAARQTVFGAAALAPRPGFPRSFQRGWRGRPLRARGNSSIARRLMQRCCGRTSLRRAAPPRRRSRC
jgi:pyrroline-5-carboxylate reductase